MIKQVTQVKPTKDYKVYVYFCDGKIKLFDMKKILDRGGVFSQIYSIEVFLNKCTVMNGTLAWDIAGNFDEANCLDIDPETIYKNGKEVSDPLDVDAA